MTPDLAKDLTELRSGVSEGRLMGHISEFARWTKHAGSQGELRSLEYVEATLREAGFECQLALHDAFISDPKGGFVLIEGSKLDGITHSFSRSTGPGGLTARLVAVGPGKATDYRGLDVAGAVVMVNGIANPAAALEASQRGAVGQVHISPDDRVHEMCISPVWGSPDDEQLNRLPRTAVVTLPLSAGSILTQRLLSSPVEVTVITNVDTGWRKTPILTAHLASPVGDDNEPFLLFSGHHDTWYYGVMDNGGANATMLEVARLCADRRKLWRRGLRVIFWSGHSQGRYSSSAWYADHHWEELEARAVAHVNVDSTGGRGNTVVSDTTSSAELGRLADQVLHSEADQPWSGQRNQRAGDQSFWGIGVPSIFANMSEQPAYSDSDVYSGLFGSEKRRGQGTGWWWHTPDDTADKIDPAILVRDTRIYLAAVWLLLTSSILPLAYDDHVRGLIRTLGKLQNELGARFELSQLIERAEHLMAKIVTFNERNRSEAKDRRASELANRSLVRLSRILVPLDNTLGDRFRHDAALPLGPIPALADLNRLAQMIPGSDEFLFLESRMVRARNRISTALGEAIRVLEEA